jgi:hypothetical protein
MLYYSTNEIFRTAKFIETERTEVTRGCREGRLGVI